MSGDLILIAGASSDIGVALMRRLLVATDARIVAHSFRGSDRLAKLQTEFGERVVPLQADFSDSASVKTLIEHVAVIGTPTAIVYLPALKLNYERFSKVKWPRLEADMTIQLRSAIELLQAFLPGMAKLPRARVVFVLSSVVHGVPPKFMTPYVMTKYAQLGLMRGLAAEYASTSIRINSISPSMVETQFLADLGEVAVTMSAAASPLKRNATPADLMGALELLLSPAADYIHGVDIPIAAGTIN